ncbi:cilia- and flagella-associated protein 144 [Paramormyrops kingsleyae]|uniref:Cilia and flagella associated protein 144 n=1 Tax=Paramormyrops kingsleyae TaxID=1676925 RepID=A0A3B3SMB8_9TELE|nr:protein FAM183A [Paramormyrops kingsleyae]
MAAVKPQEKVVDAVHQNAIRVETIRKELRCQKLYTEFRINPYTKFHPLTDKPMGRKTDNDEEGDRAFLEVIHRGQMEPRKKYTQPMTESQEIGWISTPLIISDRSDRRLNFPRQQSEITKFMDAAWRLQEQTRNLG